MCLGGILAGEWPDLAPEVKIEVERFTASLVEWLGRVLSAAQPEMAKPALRR